MKSRRLTTDQVEAHYRTHPPDHKGPKLALWVKALLVLAGAAAVVGVFLALAG